MLVGPVTVLSGVTAIITESSEVVKQLGWLTTTYQIPACVIVIDFVVKVGCKTPPKYH